MLGFHSTREFDWNKSTKTFAADASDLTQGGKSALFRQIFDDACDEGVILHSHVTGATSKWYVSSTRTDDGDLLDWMLLPTNDTVRTHPNLKGAKMVIFND